MKDNQALKEMAFYAKKLISVPSGNEDNSLLAGTALKNLSDFGFTLDENGVKLLSSASKEDITDWYYDTVDKLKILVGGDHEYHPFYPNFPHEVIEKSEFELLIDQLHHYWSAAIDDVFDKKSGNAWSPEGVERNSVRSLEEHPLRVLETIDGNDTQAVEDASRTIFKNLLRSKNNLSESDLTKIVNVYANNVSDWTKDVSICENRNTLSYLYAKALSTKQPTNNMPALVTNDYLRIARIASYMKVIGSSDLQNFNEVDTMRIATLPRSMRRFIANGIDAQKNIEEDIARDKQTWKALLQKIHIGEFTSCERANDVAYKLRNNIALNTFYSRIEQAFSQERYGDVVKMYQSRPGEFIKNFNRMLNVQIDDPAKKITYATQLIDACKDVFSRTRPEDLVGFVSYLKSRTREDRMAIHNIKGKPYVGEQKWAPIPESTANTFIKLAEQGIISQVKTGQSMGNVYIEPSMEKMALPKTSTSGTQALNSYTQGSRLPIESKNGEPKNVRFLLWFGKNEPEERNWDNIVDISASFFTKSENGTLLHHSNDDLAWYSSRKNSIPGCYFSGDWIGAGEHGSTEFIDIDLQQLQRHNVSHVMLYVNIWEGPESFSEANLNFGWQERNDLDKGEFVDLKAVRQHCMLNGDARGIVPVIVDVNAGELIWVDSLHHNARAGSDMRAVIPQVDMFYDMYGKGDRMDMARAAELLVEANGGTIVDSPEKADTLFMLSAYADKTENQIVHTATDQSYWVGAIAPQTIEEVQPTQEQGQVQKPIDIAELSIADIIANYDGVIASQQNEQQTQQNGQQEVPIINNDEEDFTI